MSEIGQSPCRRSRWRSARSAPAAGLYAAVRVSLSALVLSACGGAPDVQAPGRSSQSGALLAAPSSDPAVSGRWDPTLIHGEVPAVSMALLHDGRIAYWSGIDAYEGEHDSELGYVLETQFVNGHIHLAETRVMTLSGTSADIVTPEHPEGAREGDLFCSAHTILPDGRVLNVGGTHWVPFSDTGDVAVMYGINRANFFDPAVSDWVEAADMRFGRWYPTVVTLPDGNAFVASGLYAGGTSTMQTALERFDVAGNTWEHIGDQSLPMYPRLTVIPSGPLAGKLFYSTSGQLWGPSGFDPREATWNLQQACDWKKSTAGQAAPLPHCELLGPSLFGVRQHGISVLLPLDPADNYRSRILTFGGTLNRDVMATNAAEIADLSNERPVNTLAAPMHRPRWMNNGVLLPDGKVLAIGGALYDTVMAWGQPGQYVMEAELYDPEADTWQLLPPMQVARGYHSSAILLPDGRVLVGGTATLPFPSRFIRENVPGEQQLIESRFEVYEPPYLFRGERPVIRAAPKRVRYGDAFHVEAQYAGEIDSVVLVRPGATTHVYDADQRVLRLAVEQEGQGVLKVIAPPDGNVAPPGYYMLFVNGRTDQGPTPSVAAFVHVSAEAGPIVPPDDQGPQDPGAPPPGSGTPTCGSGAGQTACPGPGAEPPAPTSPRAAGGCSTAAGAALLPAGLLALGLLLRRRRRV